MYKAIIYRIEGPRSLSQAVEKFNSMDHSVKIYDRKSSVGVYIKHTIGKDFALKALSIRDGIDNDEQKLEVDANGIKIHVPLTSSAKGKMFNAVLIYEYTDGLLKPVYMTALDDIVIEDPSLWINIEVGLNKLVKTTKKEV